MGTGCLKALVINCHRHRWELGWPHGPMLRGGQAKGKQIPWPPWTLRPSLLYLSLLPPQWAACQVRTADQRKTQPTTSAPPADKLSSQEQRHRAWVWSDIQSRVGANLQGLPRLRLVPGQNIYESSPSWPSLSKLPKGWFGPYFSHPSHSFVIAVVDSSTVYCSPFFPMWLCSGREWPESTSPLHRCCVWPCDLCWPMVMSQGLKRHHASLSALLGYHDLPQDEHTIGPQISTCGRALKPNGSLESSLAQPRPA